MYSCIYATFLMLLMQVTLYINHIILDLSRLAIHTLCSSVFHLMPSGCGSSSHHFHTSCSSSFFFRPPLVGDPVPAAPAPAPFLGEGVALVAPPLFFLVGVVTAAAAAVGVAVDDTLLFDEELGVFLAFLGYIRGRMRWSKWTCMVDDLCQVK